MVLLASAKCKVDLPFSCEFSRQEMEASKAKTWNSVKFSSLLASG